MGLDEAAALAQTHLTPTACFDLSKVFYGHQVLELVRHTSVKAALNTADIYGSRSSGFVDLTVCMSKTGDFCGFGVPDPEPWVLNAHILDVLTASGFPEGSAIRECAFAPLRIALGSPSDQTSFSAVQGLIRALSYFNIQMHYGGSSRQVVLHRPVASPRAT